MGVPPNFSIFRALFIGCVLFFFPCVSFYAYLMHLRALDDLFICLQYVFFTSFFFFYIFFPFILYFKKKKNFFVTEKQFFFSFFVYCFVLFCSMQGSSSIERLGRHPAFPRRLLPTEHPFRPPNRLTGQLFLPSLIRDCCCLLLLLLLLLQLVLVLLLLQLLLLPFFFSQL